MSVLSSDLLRQQCFINGQWCDAKHGKTMTVHNPFNQQKLGTVPLCGVDETQRAIEAADYAIQGWAHKPAKERSAVLYRWYELILSYSNQLAELITLECGKPLNEARSEVQYGANFVQWFAEETKRIYGDIIPASKHNQKLLVLKQPIGVVAAITPWNFPLAMITRKCAPALAAGCGVVIKPAEATPFSALALAVLAEQAGVTPGLLNVVTGDPQQIGQRLSDSPLVKKLSFTGSTQVGKLLMQQCAGNVKKLSLELGGNAPFIVFDDTDIKRAIDSLLIAKFRNTGQTCVCANRILVQSGIYKQFTNEVARVVQQLKVGDGLQPDVQLGPLINQAGFDKVQRLVEDARDHGAQIITGGNIDPAGAWCFEPTVIMDAPVTAAIHQEEIFGPVVSIIPFDNENDAIDMANDTCYGLAAYLFTYDLARIWRMSDALEFGIVCINDGTFSNEAAPFGGVKQSGFGREGSKYGIDEFVNVKYVCLQY